MRLDGWSALEWSEQTKERREIGSLGDSDLASSALRGRRSPSPLSERVSPALPVEDKPVELTMVDLSATPPPAAPQDPPFMETDPSRRNRRRSRRSKTFESNANSIAASKLPATGDVPLPTQEGKDRPFVNLETHESSLADRGSKTAADTHRRARSRPPAPEVHRYAHAEASNPAATPTPGPSRRRSRSSSRC